ncbi:MAG: manganese efflux pump [Syntrophomonadaceae bacterium]|nr:manganese efflux pump [Syntrophomonadaceae bacterium]MDD3888587.1 manganese efflux pump [Syntrophomonadaceae bacterium]MDD4549146.1 manganese efflux pump [Syntrophomonadaceae bacterium]
MYEQLGTILLIALVLGLDAFSLSMGMGLKGVSRSYEIKFASTVGLLHIIMPLLGLNIGLAAGKIMGVWAARLGAAVLVYIAIDFFIKGYRETRPQKYKFGQAHQIISGEKQSLNNDNWIKIIILAVSVSMDALTVGFSLGTFKMPVIITSVIIGLIAGSMTILGFIGGRLFNRLIGSYAQMAGGIILLALAIKLVI